MAFQENEYRLPSVRHTLGYWRCYSNTFYTAVVNMYD